jgi:GTP-binding protein
MIRGGAGASGLGKWLGGKRGEDIVIRVPIGTVVREVRWEIEGEVEKDRDEREQMEWAWDASKIRLAEAERREKRWDAWKKAKDLAEKAGETTEAYIELDTVEVEEFKQQALEKMRRSLFVMYPQTELASHPSFLNSEHLLLSKLLSRQAATSPRKTRRRRSPIPEEEDVPLLLDLTKATPVADPILLLAGGAPGLGNPSFQSADDRSPKYATRGAEGDTMRLELEVKAGGEVGLVGQPNAGKRWRFNSSPHRSTQRLTWFHLVVQY